MSSVLVVSGFALPRVSVRGDKAVMFSGGIDVVAADRKFLHVATNEMGEPIMATPALSRGVIFVRTMNSVFAIPRTVKR